MALIAENIHIISKVTKEAILNKDDGFILDIAKKAVKNGFKTFDLNIGPAKGGLTGSFEYLTGLLLGEYPDVTFSFDTSNFDETDNGLRYAGKGVQDCFLNSVCLDEKKIEQGFEIAKKYNSNVIVLLFNPDKGIENSSEKRFEIALQIYERALEYGIEDDKLYFDPLILPVSAAQNQALTVLETIRMLKEGLPSVHIIAGLSNISNGSPAEIRKVINRTYLALCMGAGLDSVIADGFDKEIARIYSKHASGIVQEGSIDSLYCSLYNAMDTFSDIDDIKIDNGNIECLNVYRSARVLLNKEIYSHSFYAKEQS